MRRFIERSVLAASGGMLVFIGGSILFQPRDFFAMNGVEIVSDPSLLSELKAPAGLLVVAGLVMLAGSSKSRFAGTGLGLGALIYGSYGASRVISMIIDGWPSQSLMVATVIELALAALLFLYRRNRGQSGSPVAEPIVFS